MSFDERSARRLMLGALVVMVVALAVYLALRSRDHTDAVVGPPAIGDPSVLPGDPHRVPLEGFGEVALRVAPADGSDALAWCLLAARSQQQRERGLMQVTDLKGYSGMAFLYGADVNNAFYMRNTPTPLSIAWIRADGSVVSTTDMAPCEDREGCPTYPPGGNYRVAIEVPKGGLDVLGITKGATVAVGGSCAPRT